MRSAFITGLSCTSLTSDERTFLADTRPAGIIVFARNVADPGQLRRLTGDALAAIGSADTLVLVDQEGGRVQRLRPPHWRVLPPASRYKDAGDPTRAAWLVARLLAEELRTVGINTNCAPVLDVPIAGAHDVIGNRAFATDPGLVAQLGRAFAEGLRTGGIVPVIKHVPGHGRATADSHFELPHVHARRADLAVTDFAPFRDLRSEPAAMTAHVVFSDIDPDNPASTSRVVHDQVIRGDMGFEGLLMSDDLSMKALGGLMRERAEAVIAAGSDLALHCNGELAEMDEVAAGVPTLTGAPLARFERALGNVRAGGAFDRAEAEACLATLLRLIA
jgi:beta-N-acetylhexosaminidase